MKVISFLNQKGGVGKSTLARAIVCEAAKSNLAIKLADMDTQQATCMDWHRQRLDNGYEPVASVECFNKAEDIQKSVRFEYDLLVIDGAPRASIGTLEIAKISDTVVLPTCSSRDDLMPTVRLANELVKEGIDRSKIVFVLTRVASKNKNEIIDAVDFLSNSGFTLMEGMLTEYTAYRSAMAVGLGASETPHKVPKDKIKLLMDSLSTHLMREQ
jgi:chromosome partitioning protein